MHIYMGLYKSKLFYNSGLAFRPSGYVFISYRMKYNILKPDIPILN